MSNSLLSYLLVTGLIISGQSKPAVNEPAPGIDALATAVYKSTGVVRVRKEVTGKRKDLVIYNESGSVYTILSVTRNAAQFGKTLLDFNKQNLDSERLKKQFGFSPLAFYPEYTLVYFDVISRTGNRMWIYVDADKKSKKYIVIDSSQVVVQSWKEFLLNKDNSIIVEPGFDALKNPLLARPASNTVLLKDNKKAEEVSWKIRQFSGQWIEIESVEGCNPKPDKPYRGWIRWTDGKHPLLMLAYDC